MLSSAADVLTATTAYATMIVCAQVWHARYQAQIVRAEKFQPYSKRQNASGEAELLRIKMVCCCCTTISLTKCGPPAVSTEHCTLHTCLGLQHCAVILYMPKQLGLVVSASDHLAVCSHTAGGTCGDPSSQ